MSDKLIVSWDDYNNTVEKLAIQIEESNYKPTILIGIMRGAAPMIDVLSRIFKLKCAYLAVESYSGKGVEDEQGDIVFSREMSSIAPNMGGRILLCDDLSDTGITFNKSIDWLKKYEPIKGKIEDISYQLVGGLRSSMGYTGHKTIKKMQGNCKFVFISKAGARESNVHDVIM